MVHRCDIVMTGQAALKGTAVIAGHYYDRLISRLPESLVMRAKNCVVDIDITKDIHIAQDYTDIIKEVSYGGVFKSLRDIADMEDVGITVWLENIRIRQETIEICEIIDINPYMLDGTGSVIAITQYGNELVRAYENAGIQAAVIGYTTENNDKVVINKGEVRYLETRIKDELFRIGIMPEQLHHINNRSDDNNER